MVHPRYHHTLGGHHASFTLTAYVDTNYTAVIEDCKSRSGYLKLSVCLGFEEATICGNQYYS